MKNKGGSQQKQLNQQNKKQGSQQQLKNKKQGSQQQLKNKKQGSQQQLKNKKQGSQQQLKNKKQGSQQQLQNKKQGSQQKLQNKKQGSQQQLQNKKQGSQQKRFWTVSRGADYRLSNDNIDYDDRFLNDLLGIDLGREHPGQEQVQPKSSFLALSDIKQEDRGKMVNRANQEILSELLQKNQANKNQANTNQAHTINNDDNSSEISNITYNSNGRRNTNQLRNDLLKNGLLNHNAQARRTSDNNLLTEQIANRMAKQFVQKVNTVGDRNNLGIHIKNPENQNNDSQKSASVKGTLGSSRQNTQRGSKQQTQSGSKQQKQK
jgi:hypothetical protein